ncbi:MAG: ABC transporter ATP-binding protein [Acidimicrobiia bacterium]
MLEIIGLSARYGAAVAVRSIDMDVAPGELVACIGPNGAGKTTLLRAIMGQHAARDGAVTVDGRRLGAGGPTDAARAGIAIVPQGRRLFPSLTVDEHLAIAVSRARPDGMGTAELFEYFPSLARRRRVRAASLSGGEQQMLAIGRAALLGPRYILMDEPTEGLAPAIVSNVAGLVEQLPKRGIGVVVTDQHAGPLVRGADRTYHMDRGSMTAGAVGAGRLVVQGEGSR